MCTMKVAQMFYVFALVLSSVCLGETATTKSRNRDPADSKFLKNEETYKTLSHDVAKGTKIALDTCATIFKNTPWNCFVEERIKRIPAFFGKILPANREGAILHSLGSATVMYTLTRNCRAGKYEDCACIPVSRPPKPGQNWRWAGCRENLRFGENMAKHFIDKLEALVDSRRAALNLHNNEVGRKMVKIATRKVCKCHGATGSCQLKTCWKELLHLTEVAEMLKEKYDNATHVTYVNKTIQPISSSRSQKGHVGLAFFETSPNYCHADRTTGFPGVRGRKCVTGRNSSTCERMCRSCGLQSRHDVKVESEKCKCKFEWCCRVTCQTCLKQVKLVTCH